MSVTINHHQEEMPLLSHSRVTPQIQTTTAVLLSQNPVSTTTLKGRVQSHNTPTPRENTQQSTQELAPGISQLPEQPPAQTAKNKNWTNIALIIIAIVAFIVSAFFALTAVLIPATVPFSATASGIAFMTGLACILVANRQTNKKTQLGVINHSFSHFKTRNRETIPVIVPRQTISLTYAPVIAPCVNNAMHQVIRNRSSHGHFSIGFGRVQLAAQW